MVVCALNKRIKLGSGKFRDLSSAQRVPKWKAKEVRDRNKHVVDTCGVCLALQMSLYIITTERGG